MNADERGLKTDLVRRSRSRSIGYLSVFICVHLWLIVSSACSSKRTDLRTLVPAESLVYLESNDLAATLQPLIDAKPFREAAKSRPDFSALKGVQIAVAVTGFETSEEKLTDENSLARVQPRFAAVADTHSWNYAAVTFAEQKLGSFVADIYGGEPKLEKTDKHGGKYYTWTATDGRKAFGLVIDSLIYFGNDETAIEKCLAVRRGESDNILKTGKIQPASADVLAAGYVSSDGVAQIAGLLGIQLAAQSSDEPETQSAIAGIVPQLIRGTVSEASWTMKRSDKRIEDSVIFGVPPEMGRVFSETIVAADPQPDPLQLQLIPGTASSVTRYNLKDVRLAWRSAILAGQKLTDPITGQIISEVARVGAAEYGIDDPEQFLASIKPDFLTIRMDPEGEASVVIAEVADFQGVKKSISKEIVITPTVTEGAPVYWQSKDGDLAVAGIGNLVVIGSPESVRACSEKHSSTFANMLTSGAAVTTAGRETTTAAKLIDIIAHENTEMRSVSTYVNETRFTQTGIERRTVSDFGLVGAIIGFLDED
jgi:hypothetical protein